MKTAIVLAILLLAPLVPATLGTTAAPAGCSAGEPEAAAAALLGEGATIAALDEAAGLPSALAMLPVVHPGARHRMIEAQPGLWCDAIRGFDAAWTIAGAQGDDLARASAFASVAAARWMDGVTVERADLVAPGLVILTTHARTNGIVADWTVRADAEGIVEARAVSRAIAVEPFHAQIEGFTALPGLVIEFARGEDGLEVVSPSVAPPAPSATFNGQHRASDGFFLRFSLGPQSGYPNTTLRTGIAPVDNYQWIRETTIENYEEFLSWGLRKGWTQNAGTVSVDDPTALQCLACVFISQEFNIHISSQVVTLLAVLAGTDYPDERAALSTVIGHEMLHNFQNAYYKPGAFMENSFIEGAARFSETLHAYSDVSHQPNSLVYTADGNGCNQETATPSAPSLASGPSTGQAYSACNFWLSWYGQHGIDGFVALFEAANAHNEKLGWTEFKDLVEDATDAPIDADLAAFAHTLITGEGLVWGPASGAGPTHDWAEHLRRWIPPTRAPGSTTAATIADGGMTGLRASAASTATVSGAGVVGYVLAPGTTPAPIAGSASVPSGAYVVAIHPGAGSATASIALT